MEQDGSPRAGSRRPALLFAAATLLGAASFAASARQSPALVRVSIWLGGYYSHADTRLSAGVPARTPACPERRSIHAMRPEVAKA